jgi:hypothetical protein
VSPPAPTTQGYHESPPANGVVVSCVMLIGNWNPGLPVRRMISKLTDEALLWSESSSKALNVHWGWNREDRVHPSGPGTGSSIE